MTMKNRCVEITPAIDCHLDQRVWREGPLLISGRGDTITLQQSVRARAIVRGRGEIGRHIRKTANGAARFTVSAKPRIMPDWRIVMPVDVGFRWTERPNLVLANVFRITFGAEAERHLKRAVDEFKKRTLPAELAQIDIKSRIGPLWVKLQDPIRLDTGRAGPLWLHFRPDAIGMAPLNLANGKLTAAASIAGQMQVTDRRLSPFFGPKTHLPSLGPAMADGLSILIPASVSMMKITQTMRAELPKHFRLRSPVEGNLEVRTATAESVGRRLLITLEAEVRLSGLADYSGTIVMSGIPVWLSAETTLTIASDPKHLGARIGITSVLHTWGSAMTNHPHVHMIVPGGGLSADGSEWIACRPNFFLSVRVLSRLFRRLFLEGLVKLHREGRLAFFGEHAGLVDSAAFDAFLAPLRKSEWVVYAKEPFAGPKAVLAHLSRYTHRVAISNSRLIRADADSVTFRVKDYRIDGPGRHKTLTLDTHEFIRRFLIHVLPKGQHRIRHYGLFANGNRAANIARIRELLAAAAPATDTATADTTDGPRILALPCPCCGGRLIITEAFGPGAAPRHRPDPEGIDSS